MSSAARSRNAVATRQAILDSARQYFQHDGYDNAGVRAIAAEAGVDAALICRYFGSKKQLFAEVLQSASEDPMEVFRGSRHDCGERVAKAAFDPAADQATHMLFMSLVIGATRSPDASQMAHRHIQSHFIDPVSAWLGGDRAREKAWLICSLLMGAVVMNNIQPAGPTEQRDLARQLQSIVDG